MTLTRLAAAAVLALAALPALAQPSGKLVLYTSQPNADAQATVDAFIAAHPGVEVEWFRDGTTKVMAKLAAEFEAGAPQPDVLLIADSVTMEALKKDGRLQAHPGADVSGYADGLMDAERMWFSTKLITTGIVYNTAAPVAPTSWADLLAPGAKGQVVLASPMTSGAATIHMQALTALPEFGWAYYEGLAGADALAIGGNGGVQKAVAGGEKLYGIVVDFLPIREALKGAPVKFVFPTEGVSAVTEPVAILSTAKNVEAARAFVDFLISAEGQALASRMGYLPAHPDATPPEGFPALSSIKLLTVDSAASLANDAADKLRFTELFGG